MIFCAKDLIYIVFAAAAIWFVHAIYKRDQRSAIFFAANLFITFILLQIAGHLYVDHRPFVDHHLTRLVQHAAGQSFPSDHTTAAGAIALGFLLFTRFKTLGWLLAAATLLIGFARIFTGLHYPVDIAGGIVTALVGAAVTAGIYRLTAKYKSE
jgi:undecaprenyl-diphosphatase